MLGGTANAIAPPPIPIPVHPPVMKPDFNARRRKILTQRFLRSNADSAASQKSIDVSIEIKSAESSCMPIVPPRVPRPPDYPAHLSSNKNPRNKRIPSTARPIRLTGVIPNGPITPKEAISRFSTILAPYELMEILNYPEIFYIGNINRKNKLNVYGNNYANDQFNSGFDDRNNNYKLIPSDHLGYRFEIVSVLGAGAFGQVVRCIDHKTNQNVAIKVVVNTPLMHEQGQIEVQILRRLLNMQNRTNTNNVVRAIDFFLFRNHLCISFEILGPNLYSILKTNNFVGLSKKFVRTIAQNIFKGIEQCHKQNIIHCDIKLENILQGATNFNNNNNNNPPNCFKLIDFGSSCFFGHQRYQYIQSRFYRAPEVILGVGYGAPMDIWSAAVVIVELLTGKPLFPGNDEADMISLMIEVLGRPPPAVIQAGRRRREFFDDYFRFRMNLTKIARGEFSRNLKVVLNDNDQFLFDFLMRCLTWDPTIRLTASEALKHPWMIQNDNVILPDLH